MDQFLQNMYSALRDFWPHLVGFMAIVAMITASAHAVLHKRDVRATIGWVGLILLTPLLGATLYYLLGINRIKRRGTKLRSGQTKPELPSSDHTCSEACLKQTLGVERHMATLVELMGRLTSRPLLEGNRVDPLVGGDAAYPAMIAAIDGAQTSVSLMSYIFDNDRAGRAFAEALGRAAKRGVQTRVLVDDIGSHYTFPTIISTLRKLGVPAETFLKSLVPGYFAYSNLRNHRKIMVVDGRIGFTGGMNIREGCMLNLQPRHPVQDTHFRVAGPVVRHLQEVFADDWAFATGESTSGDLWFPSLEPVGEMLARGIHYGPDEDLGEMHLGLVGALSCAHTRVSIMTPYFLPDNAIIAALNVAAMRGVEVDIILPEKNNLITVQWASTAMLWEVLEHDCCRVFLAPPPFDHTKLMLVDGLWTLLGSGNWDPRSLRLNFEFNVECYSRPLATQLQDLFDKKRSVSREVTLAEVDGRSLPVKLRDGVARLLTPYL